MDQPAEQEIDKPLSLFTGLSGFRFEKADDGSDIAIVSGIATNEALDSDGERISLKAVEAALPDYLKFANIREQHDGKRAVGVAIEHAMKDDGLHLTAKIVDSEAVKKIRHGVYKGFSVGAKALKQVGNLITALRINEFSIVDRPANPDCVFDMVKGEVKANKGISENDVEKCLSDVFVLVPAVESLTVLYQHMMDEEAMEGEATMPPFVEELFGIIQGLASVFTEVVEHEVAELMAVLDSSRSGSDGYLEAQAQLAPATPGEAV